MLGEEDVVGDMWRS